MERTRVVDSTVTAADILDAAASVGDSGERITFVMDSPTPLVIRAARSRLIDLAARVPETSIVDGVTHVGIAPAARPGRRYPWGRLAVERVLVLSRGEVTQASLAAATGISQQAVSKILRDAPAGRSRELLLDAWLREYPTLAAASSGWSSVAEVVGQADAVTRYLDSLGVACLVSGDAAQGVLAPRRIPHEVIMYVDRLVPLKISDMVTSTEAPTVTLKVPVDPTVWPTARWFAEHFAMGAPWPVVDPLIVLADIYRASGPDAVEAADYLRQEIADGLPCVR